MAKGKATATPTKVQKQREEADRLKGGDGDLFAGLPEDVADQLRKDIEERRAKMIAEIDQRRFRCPVAVDVLAG